MIGPLRWDASLRQAGKAKANGQSTKGDRLPKPCEMIEDDSRFKARAYPYESETEAKVLLIKQVQDVYWPRGAGDQPVQLVLIRDFDGVWRDEVLLSTDQTLDADEVINGYFQRWSVEVAYAESKQLLGFHDPQVWCEKSVERAAPMAWFVGVVVTLWYAMKGVVKEQVRRERPWYQNKPDPTFADMLATCRYDLWTAWLKPNSDSQADFHTKIDWILKYLATSD